MSSLRVLISSDQIKSRIAELGAQIDKDYPNGPVYLIAILKGACFFLSDLARAIDRDVSLDFMGIASYGRNKTSSGEVRVTKDLDGEIDAGGMASDLESTGIVGEHPRLVVRKECPNPVWRSSPKWHSDRFLRRFSIQPPCPIAVNHA